MMSSPWKRTRVKTALGRAGRWTLVSVVLAFALIGFLRVTRGIAVHRVEGVGADRAPIGVGEPQFPLLVTMLTGASLAEGNRVEVTVNGDGTYPRLWEDLRSARESITLQLCYG
jgi:cardiolipin synthase